MVIEELYRHFGELGNGTYRLRILTVTEDSKPTGEEFATFQLSQMWLLCEVVGGKKDGFKVKVPNDQAILGLKVIHGLTPIPGTEVPRPVFYLNDGKPDYIGLKELFEKDGH